jgi:hypothetical protein
MQDANKRGRFAHLYKVIAGVLFLSPIAAFNANWFLDTTFGIYTFAAYWFVKSRELETTEPGSWPPPDEQNAR